MFFLMSLLLSGPGIVRNDGRRNKLIVEMFFAIGRFFYNYFMVGFSEIVELSFILHSELEDFSRCDFVLIIHWALKIK